MQHWKKLFAAAGLAVVVGSLANPVLAQPPGGGQGRGGRGGFGGPGGGMMGGGGQTSVFSVLRSEDVQKEIAITEDQKTKATKLGEELATALREMRPEFNRDGGFEEFQKKMAEARPKMDKATEEKKAALAAVLSADQMKRLEEIVLQVKGPDALTEAELQTKLMVTEEQKAKLANVSKEFGEKMRASFGGGGGGGDREAAREKMTALQKERSEAMVAVLSPAQAEQYDMMKGKAVDVDAIRRAVFGGGRGPGGGGPGGGRGGDRPQRPATDN